MRDFCDRLLIPFAAKNPQVEVVLSQLQVRSRHPFVVARYLSDPDKDLSLRGLSAEQVLSRMQLLRDSRPGRLRKWAKAFRMSPSIQGPWSLGQTLSAPHHVVRA